MKQRMYNFVYIFLSLLGKIDAQDAIVLFLRAGTQTSVTEAWDNSTLSDGVDTDKHEWSIREMILGKSDFRSPIIDELNSTEVTEVYIQLFNYDGEELWEIGLQPNLSKMVEDFIPQPAYFPQAKLTFEGPDPGMAVRNTVDPEKVAFFEYYQNPRSDMSFEGQQFLFSTRFDEDYAFLPAADYVGCYEIYHIVTHSDLLVRRVSQCTAKCLSTPSTTIAISADSASFSCFCLPSDGATLPLLPSTSCESRCDDDLPCGSASASYIGTVYTLDAARNTLEQIYQVTSTGVMDTHIQEDDTQVSLPDLVYINGITISEPGATGNYRLSFSHNSCSTSNGDSWIPIKTVYGYEKVFSVNQFYDLMPVPAHCVDVSMTFVKNYYYVSIQYVQEDFLFAPYLSITVIRGIQTESTTSSTTTALTTANDCVLTDLMADPNIISVDNITIMYQEAPVLLLDYASPIQRSVPAVAIDVLKAKFLHDPEFWIDTVEIWSDQDILIKILLETTQSCTDQNTGSPVGITATYTFSGNSSQAATYINDFAMVKGAGRMYCASSIKIETKAENPQDIPSVFDIQIFVYGCKNTQGATMVANCNSQNLLLDSTMESRVTVKWFPIQNEATEALRAQGGGLMMSTIMNPSVWITTVAPGFRVKQIKISGNIFRANVSIDGTSRIIHKSADIDASLKVVFSTPKTMSEIGVTPLEADTLGVTFYTFNLRITGCMPSDPTTLTPWPTVPSVPSTLSSSAKTTSEPNTLLPSSTAFSTKQSTFKTTSKPKTTFKPTTIGSSFNETITDAICCMSFCESNINIPKAEMDERIKEIEETLIVPKTNISALRRKKISAEDSRPSAVAVGTICGVVVLVMEAAVFLLMDVDHWVSVAFMIRMFIKNTF